VTRVELEVPARNRQLTWRNKYTTGASRMKPRTRKRPASLYQYEIVRIDGVSFEVFYLAGAGRTSLGHMQMDLESEREPLDYEIIRRARFLFNLPAGRVNFRE
jgi:hypothetical protein